MASLLEKCIESLHRGQLTEEELRAAFAGQPELTAPRGIQSLLYAAAAENSVFSGLVALSIIENGERVAIPELQQNWPYGRIIDALQAGWRIVKFPDFVPDESRNYALGCEFILEK